MPPTEWRAPDRCGCASGNDDGAGGLQQFHAAIGQYLNAAGSPHRALIDGDDPVLVPREVELGPCQAEDLHRNAKLKGTEAVVGQDRYRTGCAVHLAESSQ